MKKLQIYNQRGENSKYPEKIVTWTDGEPYPNWITDNAHVLSLGPQGQLHLDIRKRKDNSYEIISIDGFSILVIVRPFENIICFGDNKIFPLTKTQFNLLYRKEKG